MSIPVKINQTKKENTVYSIDPAVASLPIFMKKVTAKVVTEMKVNEYYKYGYKAMVKNCNPLNENQ